MSRTLISPVSDITAPSSSSPLVAAELVRQVLASSWLPEPPPLPLSPQQFAAAIPLLTETHAHVLAWWRIRDTPLAETELGSQLADAFRLTALGNAICTRYLARAVQQFRAEGIEPILVKGWSIARHYPSPGLRPLGDIDLFVPRAQIARACRLNEALQLGADIQRTTLYDDAVFMRDYERLWERVETCMIEGVEVRVLGPEDQLRLLCLHLLDHGAWRPLWLTDVAVALATRPAEFDWTRVLDGPPHVAQWVLSAAAMAHRLLDAPVTGTPVGPMLDRMPRWLINTVLHHWSLGNAFATRQPLAQLLPRQWRHPAELVKAMRLRWPDPIRASMFCRAPFDDSWRFPYQLRTALASVPLILKDLARHRRGEL